MRMGLTTLALLFGSSAVAAPITIRCDVTIVSEVKSNTTEPEIKSSKSISWYILDDSKKTIHRFDQYDMKMKNICDGCKINYGPNVVTFYQFEKNRPYSDVDDENYFTLNRVSGKISIILKSIFGTATSAMRINGTCSKSDLPKPLSTKF
jgi:hypothetical protein